MITLSSGILFARALIALGATSAGTTVTGGATIVGLAFAAVLAILD